MGIMSILEKDLTEVKPENKKSFHKGLSSKQAKLNLDKYGPNILKEKKQVHPVKIFVNQYKDILTLILLISTAVSIFLGECVEAIAIGVIVMLNGIMGFVQEYRTEKTLEALKKMSSPMAKVYRDGNIVTIDAKEVTIDDIIIIEAGDRICADAIITENSGICAEESALTGESDAVEKSVSKTHALQNTLNRTDMVYMGTVITKGHGEAKVVATGMQTQMGKIADMLHGIEQEKTNLQIKLAQLGKYIAVGCLIICAVVTLLGVVRGEALLDMLIVGVSLAVAAVPEGLPAIVTISLALAVGRMVKQNALIKKLHAVETLGCTGVICSDKTGTLTQNNMTVVELITIENDIKVTKSTKFKYGSLEYAAATCAVICNNAKENLSDNTFFGEPTETALLQFGHSVGVSSENILREYTRSGEIPFDSKRKCMSVVVSNASGERYMFTKGAYDVILEKCTAVKTVDDQIPLTKVLKNKIAEQNDLMASKAMRVLGLCYKKLSQNGDEYEGRLVFLGLVGMIDPPRPEVKKAVRECKKAGIKTVMITGDHKITAKAIASQIGIYRENDLILTGSEIDSMPLEKFEQIADKVSVFARVSPKHKLMVVNALQKKGKVVAMTGDGVNDAPAVKQADIGVSMAITGTDVTKEAADIVLLDDNFATLVTAAKEGRAIYSNIRKFIRYLLSCNIGEVMTMFLGMIMGMPIILLPIQILLINLVTDGLPAIALGLEPAESDIMNKKPRKKDEGVFSDGLFSKILIRGIFIGLSTLASFVALYNMSGSLFIGRTGAYFTLVVTQLINVFECKSESKTIFGINILSNKKLIAAALVSLAILLTSIYFPPFQAILLTEALSLRFIGIALGFCMVPTIVSTITVAIKS